MRLKGKHIIWSVVLLVIGFFITFSYQYTFHNPKVIQLSEQDWEKGFNYRQQLIQIEEKNRKLRHQIDDYRSQINQLEKTLGEQEETIGDFVEQKRELQMITGELPIKGSGVAITLSDANYIPSEQNANQYIVHDRHIQLLVNELYSAGAKAIAINGQRIFSDSYVNCVGPVISVDGNQYPAPFTVEAIGDEETLRTSLELTNGVVDLLVNDNIEVTLKNEDNLTMDAKLS
ncbi:UPF0749 protein YlxW [Paraliobacillus ryukyuensis]|uniref:Uncharacterized protein YlxW (UPF0749 family) n=1 Tax=Paraliobacillus ryukyuensis TaxID=200904 RepID=A0A366EHK6_9BACI|nr:DUF881 domain-containing protein [Paraliobacillus ryukyuensis]RBP01887.1 uncharacterized protein YlxW (UPF0749 family) [Paraliobacillus ryukyuensis]